MNLQDRIYALQDWWDSVLQSRVKYTIFCVAAGVVIGAALAY